MANKPTQPLFPLGLETSESSNIKGFNNSGIIEHSPGAVLTFPEDTDVAGLPSSVRYNPDSDEFEGYYENGGWLSLGGGGIRWETLPHAPSSNLLEGRGYLINNTTGTSTVVLPSPTRVGDSITICDAYGKFATYPLTVSPAGNNLYGSTEDMTISTDNVSATFTWSGAEQGWVVTSGVGLGQGRVYSREIYTQILASITSEVTLSTPPTIVDVYADGKRLTESKYSLNGNVITFSPSLSAGTELQVIEYTPIQLGTGGGGSGASVITWIYNGGSAVGGETEITLDVVVDDVPAIDINGSRQYKNLGFTFDPLTSKITLAQELDAGDEVVVIINGTPNIYNQIDRSLQEVARSSNVKDSEVILSTNTTQPLNGMKVIYSVSEQKSYGLPALPNNIYIQAVANGKLVYNPGSVEVDLLLLPNEETTKELVDFRNNITSSTGISVIGVGQTTLDKTIFWGTPEQYGGGLGGDDTAAIAACIANHKLMVLSDKTYNATEVVLNPDTCVWGVGKTKSIIKASAPTGFFFQVRGAGGVGYSGEVSGIGVDGNRLVDWTGYFGGDATTTVTKATIRNSAFRNGIKANVVLDAVQNSLFMDLDVANSVDFEGQRGIYLVNGAGNNMIMNLECSGGSIGSIVMGRDAGFPCWPLNTFTRNNTNNTITRCIGESISVEAVLANRKRSVLLEYANSNTFSECDLVTHGTYGDCAVKITDTCSYNTFDNVSFGSNPSGSIPAIINQGFNTRVFGGNMDGFGSPEITTTQGIMVRDCRNLAGDYVKVQNLAGNTNANIQGTVKYSETSGDTLPTFNNPNDIVCDNDGRVWATRGTSFGESVQFLTGYQRSYTNTMTIDAGVGSTGLQLPGFGVYEIEVALKDNADGSHRATFAARVSFHSGVQSLNESTITANLAATDGQFNTPAIATSTSGFVTLNVNVSSITSATIRINLVRKIDLGF